MTLQMNSKNKNIRDLHRRINEFMRVFQPTKNLLKDENVDLLADSRSILNRRKNYFSHLLNAHNARCVTQITIQGR
jgi:hypothetical protein